MVLCEIMVLRHEMRNDTLENGTLRYGILRSIAFVKSKLRITTSIVTETALEITNFLCEWKEGS